nr:hypothetical protein Iba_chr13aCG6170 [Ipomoea batatas]
MGLGSGTSSGMISIMVAISFSFNDSPSHSWQPRRPAPLALPDLPRPVLFAQLFVFHGQALLQGVDLPTHHILSRFSTAEEVVGHVFDGLLSWNHGLNLFEEVHHLFPAFAEGIQNGSRAPGVRAFLPFQRLDLLNVWVRRLLFPAPNRSPSDLKGDLGAGLFGAGRSGGKLLSKIISVKRGNY